MKLFVLWLDACDIKYARKDVMPNLHDLVGELHEISTEASGVAISAKALSCFYFNKWSLDEGFNSLKEKVREAPRLWENLDAKKAFLHFPYLHLRTDPDTFYSEPSPFLEAYIDGYSREDYLRALDKGNRQNEAFFYDFLDKRRDEFDIVFMFDEILDGYSHVEIGEDLEKRYAEKDRFIGRIKDFMPNLIIFSDHGAHHNPRGLIFSYRLPFEIELPISFIEVSGKIREIWGRLG